jgi:lysophospholipase L1-like esterase
MRHLRYDMGRRSFFAHTAGLAMVATASSVVHARGKTSDEGKKPDDGLQWHDVRDWGVEGKGFNDTESDFDRLPARAKGVVRDAVWNLSRHSAGMMVRFRTNATSIHADYGVTSSNLAMPHMPATGVSGIDLYALDTDAKWKWVAVTQPKEQQMKVEVVSGLDQGTHDFAAYLPLYNGTTHLKIGVPRDATFEPIAPRREKPIVFYGTSITHGACASRPGMAHPSILGRRLNRPIINFGFSGNGMMEETVGRFLVELDPAAFVIDCLPNMTAEVVTANTISLVKQLRAARPEAPIVLVEDRTYPAGWLKKSMADRNRTSRNALKVGYQKLLDAGTPKLFYIDGESLLNQDREGTTDGSHPSDLGFVQHADAMETVLRKALEV